MQVRAPAIPLCYVMLQGFCGLLLLAISALSTIINILGGVTLALAWIGLVVYFFTGRRWSSNSPLQKQGLKQPTVKHCLLS